MRKGYNTKSRNTIIEILNNNKDITLSAESILNIFNTKYQKVNITTIYRNLEKLEKEKIIHKFPASDSHKALYQITNNNLKNEEHLHLQCSKCGKIIHLDCNYMKNFILHIKSNHDFDLTCDKSILFGLCQECKNKDSNI